MKIVNDIQSTAFLCVKGFFPCQGVFPETLICVHALSDHILHLFRHHDISSISLSIASIWDGIAVTNHGLHMKTIGFFQHFTPQTDTQKVKLTALEY